MGLFRIGAGKSKMAKRTRKVGITGKYGTRYGASLRKMVKKIEVSQHGKCTCVFLWKGHHEEEGCRHLELQDLPQDSCWWRLGVQYHCCCYRQERCPPSS